MEPRPLSVDSGSGLLSAELLVPPAPHAALVLAHGAGAGFRHASMISISDALAAAGVATLRFNFPFMEAGRRRVDARPVAVSAIREAFAEAAAHLPDVPLYVGGHSFGGRMASHAVAEAHISPRGLICLSFPLHPATRPGNRSSPTGRAAHLPEIDVPMLFLSGTRDALAEPELLADVVAKLGPRARLRWLEDADHGYRVRKRVRQDPRSVFDQIAAEVAEFTTRSA